LIEAYFTPYAANAVTSEFEIPYWWQVSRTGRLIDKAEMEIRHEQ
jgi:hypothetical protein